MEGIRLSPRLQMNVNMVEKTHVAADVGCDHAYAAIWLYINKIADRVLAMDINDGPIRRAKENVEKFGLSDYIDVIKSDGIKELKPNDANCLMIAGMGGILMIKILSDNRRAVDTCSQLVLQPQSDIAKVRAYLRDNGFMIDREDMIIDEGKFYTSIHAIHKTDFIQGYNMHEDEVLDLFGEYLLRRANPILKKQLIHLLNTFTEQKKKANDAGAKVLEEKISIIREGMKYYGM